MYIGNDYRTLIVEKSKLEGVVSLAGAKNSALRLLAASILTDGEVVIENYPSDLLDAKVHVGMLELLGKKAELETSTRIKITEDSKLQTTLDWNDRSIRNTLLILGALVARFGEGRVPLPGGCKLGERKYDLHIMLLERLGAVVWEEGDFLCAQVNGKLQGNDIYLPLRSTGATENSIIAATLAQGKTRVWNPHIRPEIIDLISMLRKMGANIQVHGQEHIEIDGVEGLNGTRHSVIPDNMEAITWLVGAVVTGGDIEIIDFPKSDLEVVLAHLKAAGANLYFGDNSLIVRGGSCFPIEISTGPHPGINSDVQPILAAWAAMARGESRIIDLRFPGRYEYAQELGKMGLDFRVSGDLLEINGKAGTLSGAPVRALDLRAGAALALAGLTASGETLIEDAWQISRGYVDFPDKIVSLGGRVRILE